MIETFEIVQGYLLVRFISGKNCTPKFFIDIDLYSQRIMQLEIFFNRYLEYTCGLHDISDEFTFATIY